MKKFKHNKKRNSAFLFETLVREYTKATFNKERGYRGKLATILKESFNRDTVLGKDLMCFRLVYKELGSGIRGDIAEKLLSEAKKSRQVIDIKALFKEQTALLKQIRELEEENESNILDNFVPNYKSLATISQIFGGSMPVRSRVILEQTMVDAITGKRQTLEEQIVDPVDTLTYKMFTKRFNETYGSKLLKEQQELLSHFVFSFTDNGVSLKAFLNEEFGRLKEEIETLQEMKEVKQDQNMLENASKVLEILSSFALEPLSEKMLHKTMEIQELVKEARSTDG